MAWAAHRAAPGWPAHRWRIPIGACHRGCCTNEVCRTSAGSQRSKRVADGYHRAAEASGLNPDIGAWVFTFPPAALAYLVDERQAKELRRAARAIVQSVHLEAANLSRADGWQVAGLEVYHPEGREAPGVWRPHIHMQVSLIAWHRTTGLWRHIPTWIAGGLVFETVRAAWANATVRILGCPREALYQRDDDGSILLHATTGKPLLESVVHYNYMSAADAPKWHHRIRYDLRAWPEWRARWRRVIRWGWMAPRTSKLALGERLEPVDESPAETARNDVCPSCGCTMDVVRLNPERLRWMARAETVKHLTTQSLEYQRLAERDTS